MPEEIENRVLEVYNNIEIRPSRYSDEQSKLLVDVSNATGIFFKYLKEDKDLSEDNFTQLKDFYLQIVIECPRLNDLIQLDKDIIKLWIATRYYIMIDACINEKMEVDDKKEIIEYILGSLRDQVNAYVTTICASP